MAKGGPDGRAAAGRALSRRALNRLLPALPLALSACATSPTEPVPGAPWHHTANGFRNPPGSPRAGGDFGDWFGFFWRNFRREGATDVPDGHVLPPAAARSALAAFDDGDSITWLGHASFLFRLGGRTVLTDPFLTDHASPIPPFGPRRFAQPGLRPDELPRVDLLLLSHNHYDHLDLPTIEAVAEKSRVQVLVPLGLAGYFTARGYPRVAELDWHQSLDMDGLRVTSLPAIHFSKRTLFDRNRTLWTGYAVEGAGRRVFFAGDTAYGPVFPELGRTLAPFDLGLVPIGAYAPRELMRASHATPEEAVRIGRDLRIRRLVAMHWGTIRLTDEPPFEPPARFRAAARAAGYADEDAWLMRIGETRPV